MFSQPKDSDEDLWSSDDERDSDISYRKKLAARAVPSSDDDSDSSDDRRPSTLSNLPSFQPPIQGLKPAENNPHEGDNNGEASEAAETSTALVVVPDTKKKKKKKKKERKKKEKKEKKEKERTQRPSITAMQSLPADRVTTLDMIDSDDASFKDFGSQLLVLVFVLGCVGHADSCMLIPCMSNYTKLLGYHYVFYGCLIGAFNVGQMVICPLLGYWSDKRDIKEVFLFSSFLGALGNLGYFMAGDRPIWIFLARGIAGAGAGHILVAYAHIMRITPRGPQRDARLQYYSWASKLAMCVSSGLGMGVINSINSTEVHEEMKVTKYTFPAIVVGSIYGLMFLGQLVHMIMTCQSGQKNHVFSHRVRDEDLEAGIVRFQHQSLRSKNTVTLVAIYFTLTFVYWTMIAAVYPFAENEFNWSLTTNYSFLLFVSTAFILSFAAIPLFVGRTSDEKLISIALILVAMGGVFLFQFERQPIHSWQLYFAAAFIACGFCFGETLIPKMFAYLTGLQMEDVSLRQSWLFVAVALARGIGPVAGAALTQNDEIKYVAVVICLVSMFTLVFVVQLLSSAHKLPSQDSATEDKADGDHKRRQSRGFGSTHNRKDSEINLKGKTRRQQLEQSLLSERESADLSTLFD